VKHAEIDSYFPPLFNLDENQAHEKELIEYEISKIGEMQREKLSNSLSSSSHK